MSFCFSDPLFFFSLLNPIVQNKKRFSQYLQCLLSCHALTHSTVVLRKLQGRLVAFLGFSDFLHIHDMVSFEIVLVVHLTLLELIGCHGEVWVSVVQGIHVSDV